EAPVTEKASSDPRGHAASVARRHATSMATGAAATFPFGRNVSLSTGARVHTTRQANAAASAVPVAITHGLVREGRANEGLGARPTDAATASRIRLRCVPPRLPRESR